ncbi:MAG TPA: cytochrome c oxidase subunit 3 [Bryobacteraceae bacterium]|jgi:cytochrome c oxidase subunit 3|nr:cytochrome c oxidase subunit 3 [Bryobacteraceae bacterium]
MPANLETVAEPDDLVVLQELEINDDGGNGGGPRDFDPGDRGGGGGDDDGEEDAPPGIYRISMWATLTSISTLFAVLAIAYLARSRNPKFWEPITLPRVLWASTAVLLISSVTCQAARRAMHHVQERAYAIWLGLTAVLGLTFLTLQIDAWRQFAAKGAFLSENPHSSFFYLFTAVHGLHLLCGVLLILFLSIRAFLPAWRRRRIILRKEIADVTAIYWHFMDGLWCGLFLLLLLRG